MFGQFAINLFSKSGSSWFNVPEKPMTGCILIRCPKHFNWLCYALVLQNYSLWMSEFFTLSLGVSTGILQNTFSSHLYQHSLFPAPASGSASSSPPHSSTVKCNLVQHPHYRLCSTNSLTKVTLHLTLTCGQQVITFFRTMSWTKKHASQKTPYHTVAIPQRCIEILSMKITNKFSTTWLESNNYWEHALLSAECGLHFMHRTASQSLQVYFLLTYNTASYDCKLGFEHC